MEKILIEIITDNIRSQFKNTRQICCQYVDDETYIVYDCQNKMYKIGYIINENNINNLAEYQTSEWVNLFLLRFCAYIHPCQNGQKLFITTNVIVDTNDKRERNGSFDILLYRLKRLGNYIESIYKEHGCFPEHLLKVKLNNFNSKIAVSKKYHKQPNLFEPEFDTFSFEKQNLKWRKNGASVSRKIKQKC